MNEYLVIIRGEDVAAIKSPEEMQLHLQHWQKWMGGLMESGTLVTGQPLSPEARSLTNGGATITDRPLAEGKELVGGYLIFKANNIDEAAEHAKGCPGFEHDCQLEIRAIQAMG